jgi:hypothetical protein
MWKGAGDSKAKAKVAWEGVYLPEREVGWGLIEIGLL